MAPTPESEASTSTINKPLAIVPDKVSIKVVEAQEPLELFSGSGFYCPCSIINPRKLTEGT